MSLAAASLFSLDGRVAVLTGASGFLGRAMGDALLENGARLVALGRSERVVAQGEKWISRHGPDRVSILRADLRDGLDTALDEILVAETQVDVLVNNAHELGPASGFNVPEGTLDELGEEPWLRHVHGGLWWAARATQRCGERMPSGGSVINISSMYGLVAPSPRLYEGTSFVNPPGYSAAKAALLALTRYTASFWGPRGIRANAVVPGPFSNVEEQGPNAVDPDDPFLERLAERTCLGRVGRPHELAGALLFLASDASSFVTGHALVVDGGWTVI